ncbi:MAG TPA: 6-bladed beta-propeller [Terriglobales bacterium]|nr:6-bladed beta-propeller [Terriglobales bacterium]
MPEITQKSMRRGFYTAALILLVVTWVSPAIADKKKKDTTPPEPQGAKLDISNIVWPQPPAIARVRYLDYFSAEKPVPVKQTQVKKKSWMDRMAGVNPDDAAKRTDTKPRFELGTPYGMAVDSKGMLYVADTKVGGVFIFNPESRDTEFIKHGVDAKFGRIFGLVIDDADRLFVADGMYNHVLVFNPQHKLEGVFGEGIMNDPGGLAIDEENRYLYVANTGSDQVLVYDADTFKLLRKIGTAGKDHTLTTPGDFSKPTNVAVDKDGNLFVTDTLNDRVEVFDADGGFIRAFGKNGDGPGDFARPKGIAVDCDGHVWVADAMLNRVQVFTAEGNLRLIFGGFGMLPGQFQALAGITIDKQNRVFTSEQYMGRVQMFRYITNTEAQAEYDKRKAAVEKKADQKPADQTQPASKPGEAPKVTTPAASPSTASVKGPS